MPTTPDDISGGTTDCDLLILEESGTQPANPGEFRNDGDILYAQDSTGVFNLRQAALTSSTPADVTKAAAAVGVATTAARADHKHDVSTAAPATGIGGANAEGSSTSLARADHNHALRTTTGPTDLTIAAVADGEVLQRSGTTIIGATVAALTASAPANVTKAAAAVGVATTAARADHKHDITTAAAADTGTSNAEGSSTSLARADHTHKVVGLQAVDISATAPTTGHVLTATSATAANWQAPSGGGDVTAAATIADNRVVRGDGGAKGVQQSGVTLDDSDNLSAVQSLAFKITGGIGAHAEGKIGWDPDHHTLVQYLDEVDIAQQLGQEFYIRVYNNSGSTIVNGKPVYVSGTEATEDRPTIALARADALSTSEVVGFATHDIENLTYGYITSMGLVNDLDTSAFVSGDTLYLDEATAGAMRSSPPPEGSFQVLLGYVIKVNATTGRILVTIHPDLGLPAGDTQRVVYNVQKGSAGTITKGQVVYITGYDTGADVSEVELADASSAATMPAFGIARDSIGQTTTGAIVVLGQITGLNTSSFSVGDALYVSETAGAFTATKPVGTALIQKIGTVVRSHVSQGIIECAGALRSNDLPNLPSAQLWAGNGSGVPAAVSVSGDAAMTNAGVVTVSDLTIASEAHGDILYRAASAWLRLPAGTAGLYLQTAGVGAAPAWAAAAALTASAPADVTKAAAAVGVSTTAARSDHKHDVTTATGVDTGTANAEGSSTSLARADHTHKVVGVQGVSISATPPTTGQVLTATSATAANWQTGAGGGDVTAAANITDHAIVRGDGGAKGVQGSVPTISDVGDLSMQGQVITDALAVNVFSTFTDAQPAVALAGNGGSGGLISLGVGGATAPDTLLRRSSAGFLEVTGHLISEADDTRNIGTFGNRYSRVWAEDFSAGIGNAQPAIRLSAGGGTPTIQLGDGTAATDCGLGRAAAGVLNVAVGNRFDFRHVRVDHISPTASDKGTVTTAQALDCTSASTGRNAFRMVLNANVTLTISVTAGQPVSFNVTLRQDPTTGSRTVTWAGTTIKWQEGSAPTLATGVNKYDVLSFYYDGAVLFGAHTFKDIT